MAFTSRNVRVFTFKSRYKNKKMISNNNLGNRAPRYTYNKQEMNKCLKASFKVVFGFRKLLRKERNDKKNFLMFDCLMKNIKENQI